MQLVGLKGLAKKRRKAKVATSRSISPPPGSSTALSKPRDPSDRRFPDRSCSFPLMGTALSKHRDPSDRYFPDFQRPCARGRGEYVLFFFSVVVCFACFLFPFIQQSSRGKVQYGSAEQQQQQQEVGQCTPHEACALARQTQCPWLLTVHKAAPLHLQQSVTGWRGTGTGAPSAAGTHMARLHTSFSLCFFSRRSFSRRSRS